MTYPVTFKEGDRVQVILPPGSTAVGPTGTVIRAVTKRGHHRSVASAQHHLGVRVEWDERPYPFSPESSIILPINLKHIGDQDEPITDPCDCPNGPTFHQANIYCKREDTA